MKVLDETGGFSSILLFKLSNSVFIWISSLLRVDIRVIVIINSSLERVKIVL